MSTKELGRVRRHFRIRKGLSGTAERPRLSIHMSYKNMYAQIIDDVKSHTIFSVSTRSKEFLKSKISGGNIKAAQLLGEIVAKKAKENSVDKVVFDRGGWAYHGRVKAMAESCRKNGLIF